MENTTQKRGDNEALAAGRIALAAKLAEYKQFIKGFVELNNLQDSKPGVIAKALNAAEIKTIRGTMFTGAKVTALLKD